MLLVPLVAVFLAACSPKLTPPTHLCSRDQPFACRPVAAIEGMLVAPHLRILDAQTAGEGKQGALLLTVELEQHGKRERFQVKWRAQSTAHGLNHPRKEVAAHALQKLLFEPEDYVFPPTRSRCFELLHYRRAVDPEARPTFAGVPCVFGTVSYWLSDAVSTEDAADEDWIQPDLLFDKDRFVSDPAYRRTLADLNLLTLVASNGDTHSKQFVFVETARGVRIYNVDFSIAFSDHRNATLGPEEAFSGLMVPALRRDSVDRLRRMTHAYARLAAAERLIPVGDDLRHWKPQLPPEDEAQAASSTGLAWAPCSSEATCDKELIVGLTQKELAIVRRQAHHLLSLVDNGAVTLF